MRDPATRVETTVEVEAEDWKELRLRGAAVVVASDGFFLLSEVDGDLIEEPIIGWRVADGSAEPIIVCGLPPTQFAVRFPDGRVMVPDGRLWFKNESEFLKHIKETPAPER